jgi:hypothetical protein
MPCSLAGLVRFEYDSRSAQDMRARTALLFALARELKLLSDIFKIGIVVVNQVCQQTPLHIPAPVNSNPRATTKVKADFADQVQPLAGLSSSSNTGNGGRDGGSVPALGMAWAYCVNTRITLHRDSTRVRACCMPAEDAVGWASTTAEAVLCEDTFTAVKCEPGTSSTALGIKRAADGAWRPEYSNWSGSRRVDDAFYAGGAVTDGTEWGPGKENYRASSCNRQQQFELSSGLAKTPGLHRPALHERIQYYPFPISGVRDSSAGVTSGGEEGRTVKQDSAVVTDSGTTAARSIRYMRLDLSASRSQAQCGFEIGVWGVRGVPR